MLWAPSAWLGGRWQARVLLTVGADGRWLRIEPESPAPPAATVLPGPVLPGQVDAHSHAFQRAFVGLAERRTSVHDDFWSWRDRMYGVALRITPEQLKAIARQLYGELLAGGFTHVCEFHYLHHAPDGTRYPDPLTMSRALAEAAVEAGIGLTLLPVLYERAGFALPALRADQRRFAAGVDDVLTLRDGVRAMGLPGVDAGVAIHSLRAATPASIHALVRRIEGDAAPVHLHIAEQTAEVDECLAATGARPIEWLLRELPIDERWQLVHATHATPAEIDAVAHRSAGVVLCPTTEANLGDGLCDLPRWLDSGAALSIGTDSHVGRTLNEELRWLDYGQRLHLRRRNIAARPGLGDGATAAQLFDRALAGGAAAGGLARWGFVVGARADLVVLDDRASGLAGMPASHLLDGWVFVSAGASLRETWVAGHRRWSAADTITSVSTRFIAAMQELAD